MVLKSLPLIKLKSSTACSLLRIIRVTPKWPFWQRDYSWHFFPKAVNRYNKALSLLCIASSSCSLNLSQLSPSRQSMFGMEFPTHQGQGWQLRGPVLTPAYQSQPKTRHRGQRTSCGVLLLYPFSKLLPNKEAFVGGKPKQHFWPFEL